MTSCPACGSAISEGDQFCESCGADLSGTETVPDAGVGDSGPHVVEQVSQATQPVPVATAARRCSCGGEIDADGWCTVCGLRALSERDHYTEQASTNVAAVCDKGRVHARNEDAVALADSHGNVVMVVCDGVSSTVDSDVASLAAARAARDSLVQATAPETHAPAAIVEFWTAAFDAAVGVAQESAVAAAGAVGAGENPPSCTFVAAVVDGPVLVAAWVGDSRCYWFGDDGNALQVSVDDSWVSGQVAQGTARAVAEADPRAHSITRWLGVDAPTPSPTCASVPVDAGGWVLVCSDGLWNYCSAAHDLGHVLVETVARLGDDPIAVASALCDWANEQGGHDNITVALARIPGVSAATGSDQPAIASVTAEAVPAAQQPA